MTKKKLALLDIQWQQIEELRKQIFMLNLDREILIKEYNQMATTDEVPPVEEIKESAEIAPLSDEAKVEIISDTVLLMK